MSTGWIELGRLVRLERKNRHLTQTEFAHEIGFKDRRIISDIEHGARDNYDEGTKDLIEIAMRWRQGSVDRVVGGGKPLLEADITMNRLRALWPGLRPEAKAVILRLVEVMTGH